MSSGLSILIIVILIAIIAAIATVVILNKYFNHQIAELDALTDELKDISVEEDIKRLEKMELAGLILGEGISIICVKSHVTWRDIITYMIPRLLQCEVTNIVFSWHEYFT